jgi:hypothetical protein
MGIFGVVMEEILSDGKEIRQLVLREAMDLAGRYAMCFWI